MGGGRAKSGSGLWREIGGKRDAGLLQNRVHISKFIEQAVRKRYILLRHFSNNICIFVR